MYTVFDHAAQRIPQNDGFRQKSRMRHSSFANCAIIRDPTSEILIGLIRNVESEDSRKVTAVFRHVCISQWSVANCSVPPRGDCKRAIHIWLLLSGQYSFCLMLIVGELTNTIGIFNVFSFTLHSYLNNLGMLLIEW